ncbi:50S ribosomal protein L9 [Nitrospina gracilis 3/211]|uniref:Large ribosomal subunit protein bL9 n=1 Tax=Nitrospina gracilis (strain 3/211) TaxID=1266370 RepID=M1ZD29_NITG3|nr:MULTISPECIES: 50S ribosomal protein L9 [Nitrospina]MCF8724173.1 large subunit ribosomal protein L9 [Nitrospina sp. Nb-3]CCQ91319.1 50S ribosomal protein L9 [Nitrospina gracilis 3/211]
MKLLLLEEVEKLGHLGDEVEVRDGYGRNYLIPQGKAILATANNVKEFQHHKGIIQRKLKKLKGEAETQAEAIGKLRIQVSKKVGDQGKLFGSVTSQEIADLVEAQGVQIDRRKIQLSDPIKALGEFEVPLKLHPEVTAKIHVTVSAEEEPKADAEEETATSEQAETESA